jgi:hypothetical protein
MRTKLRTDMRTKMRIKASLLLLSLSMYVVINSAAQEIPLVYDVENTGVDCTKPPLPVLADLPVIEQLTDPFEWSDRSGRSTSFEDWCHRRSEIGAEFEHYEIGTKPVRPDSITASYSGGVLTVIVTKNGKTLTLTSQISLPEGTGPFPAIIGMNSGTGSLPADIFTSRNIATITYHHDQVTVYNAPQASDPFYKLYPELWTHSGQYSPWAWGVSRIIDGLELVQADLPIDLKHLAVTGCSYAGKMALFSGAFDERIALTIAQESGGGGAASWRYSQTLPGVETLGNTSHQWFMNDMFQFSGLAVSKEPMDHHELMAMIAPRALFVLGNPDYVWLADESGYVSCRAAQKVWENFGISDRFGFSIVGGHFHCALPDVQKPEVVAFVDKFLLGDTTVNTNISTNPYKAVDYSYWTEWWGTGVPAWPYRERGDAESVWIETECGTIGNKWNIKIDSSASNESYAVVQPGLNSLSKTPADSASAIFIPFTVNADTTYYIFGRIQNYNSFWMKVDNGSYLNVYGPNPVGWQWAKLSKLNLTAGEHTLSVIYRKDGARLDKLCISVFPYPPTEKGAIAENICVPDTSINSYSAVNVIDASDTYMLGQNYPNPLNINTTIGFEIPRDTYVSLKVYSMLGQEITELAGKEYTAGRHTVEFDAHNLPKGIYFYRIKADKFSESRIMTLKGE